MAGRERVVEFAVKARDEYSKVLKNLEQQQNRLSAAARAANRRAVTGIAKGEIDEASANYKRLIADVERYRAAQAAAARSGKLSADELRELGDTIRLTRDRAREAMTALSLKRAALDKLGAGAKSGYAALDRLALSMERGATGAQKEGAATATAAAQLNKLSSASKTAGDAQAGLAARMDKATASMQRQQRRGNAGGVKGDAQDVEIWGLKPWQLTNLGYQVNDVVSGLAMGQAPIQILAQQAGQFAQIWPNVMVSLARSIPIIAGVTAVLAPFVAAAVRLNDTAESVRIFSQSLALSADGARYNAEALAKSVDRMREFGVATADARGMLLEFVKAGISNKDFEPLSKMAKQLSEVSGDGIVETAAKLSKAFSGTVDDVRELDKELNFLTATQLETIIAMGKAGDSTGALSLAQSILRGKLADTVREQSDWAKAVDSMAKAWEALTDAIADSGILQWLARDLQRAGKDIQNTVDDFERWGQAIKGLGTQSIDEVIDRVRALQEQINRQEALGLGNSSNLDAPRAELAQLEEILRLRREEVAQIQQGTAAEQQSTAASEAKKKNAIDIQQIVDKQVATLKEETKQAGLTNRERFIEEELLKAKNSALEQAKKLNQDILGLTEEQTAQIRKQAAAAYDAANVNYEARYTAQRGTPQGAGMAELVKAITLLSEKMQLNAKDLLTAISYETGGTFDPSIRGGAGNRYVGLFQASPDVQKRYGIDETSSVTRQVEAMGKYLADAGVKAGDGLLQIYAAINAGSASRTNASDANNGGMPGTVLDKVSEQMGDHQKKAEGILAAYAGIAQEAQKTAEYEKGFNERVKALELELGLKKNLTREAFVARELADEEARARKAGVTLLPDQISKYQALLGATYDLANANKEVNELVAQRTALFESLQIAQAAGDQSKAAGVVAEIGNVETQLTTAIEKAILFWQAMGGAGAEQAIRDLQNLQAGIGQTIEKIDRQFLPSAIDINNQLADIGGNAFSAFAQALAQGENAAQAFFNSLLEGIANFLIEIGKAIVQQALFNALSGGAGAAGSGGLGGSIAGGIVALFRHDGGVIGSGSGRRGVFNPAVFANAERYHGGGVLDLKPGEVPIIAMKDEEVLTADDPRHVRNGGKAGTAVNVKNVNVFNPVDVFEAALQDSAGQKILMNFLTRNSQKVNGAISR